jgi:Domain of unknown function (DUF5069)
MSEYFTKAPNLTQRPPRSPRVRLGGYVILPRILDKGRATLAGNAGSTGLIAQWINTGSILRESQPKR